jgi:hypothetical protein
MTMKKFWMLCLLPAVLFAQDPLTGQDPNPPAAPPPPPVSSPSPDALKPAYPGYHRHDGFYLSLNAGLGFGSTALKASGAERFFDEVIYRGAGPMIDLKIGGAILENTILSFDIIGRTLSDPKVEIDGQTGSYPFDFSTSDNSYGLGLTQYFMPHNVFVSGTVSLARMVSTIGNQHASSEWGYGLHVKAGKEWWVGTNWGLGVSAGYGFQTADDQEESGVDYQGTLTSHQFYILFNTTYN